MSQTTRLSSSLRARTLHESLALARVVAPSRGVSRVVDTTWLDRIGIPVFASMRPDAHPAILCVHAGKGVTPAEAEIGAYMEAIEYSYTEEGRSRIGWTRSTPLAVLESFQGQLALPAFCPSAGVTVRADDVMAVVEGEELLSGLGRVLVPAELVFAPFSGNPGPQVYGNSSNGVASGNTIDEAAVHALAEVMERDVQSFATVGVPSWLVDPASVEGAAAGLMQRIEAAGLRCHLRCSPNDYGLAHFAAYIVEPEGTEYTPMSVNSGVGFHCNRDVAAVRAVAEAAQSRLSTIHGGRDDLVRQHSLARKVGPEEALRHLRQSRAAVSSSQRVLSYQDVPDRRAATLQEAWCALTEGLRRAGLRHLIRIVYTEPAEPFQVVRVIVPGAEFFEYGLRRIGPRLLQHLATAAAVPGPATVVPA